VPILAMELARARLSPLHLTAATLLASTATPANAVEWGYLDQVVPAEELRASSIKEAARLGALSRAAYSRTKMALREQATKYIREMSAGDLARMLPSS
jgi:enoyl-CoA hydratase